MTEIPGYVAWPLITLVALFGLYYMLGSFPFLLEGVDCDQRRNRRRRLRRIGGTLLVTLAGLLYAGLRQIQPKDHPYLFLTCWGLIGLILVGIFILAVIDFGQTLGALKSHRHAQLKQHLHD